MRIKAVAVSVAAAAAALLLLVGWRGWQFDLAMLVGAAVGLLVYWLIFTVARLQWLYRNR